MSDATSLLTDAEHQQSVAERWEHLQSALPEKVQMLERLSRANEAQLIRQAARSSSMGKKVLWLRKAADELQRKVLPVSACRTGCSHCCHISAVLTRAEAQVIARETGAPLDAKAGRYSAARNPDFETTRELIGQQYYGQPCTFLAHGRCTIYEARPLACRLAISLDEDDLLCRITPAYTVNVPYLDVFEHQLYGVTILGAAQDFDDVRAWFPQGLGHGSSKRQPDGQTCTPPQKPPRKESEC